MCPKKRDPLFTTRFFMTVFFFFDEIEINYFSIRFDPGFSCSLFYQSGVASFQI